MSMTDDSSEARLFARMITLADTLVAGFELIDMANELVENCVELLPVGQAGIMVDDQRGNLRVLASTSEETRLLELFELQNNEGPCLEAFAAGTMVQAPDFTDHQQRWPMFTPEATALGIAGAYALPMRLRQTTIGALNLFCETPVGLTEHELHVAHMLSTMATLGIINHWTLRRQEVLAEQLQHALNSRVLIEQAKGVIAERLSVGMGQAFELLRSAARDSRRPLEAVARDVASGRLTARDLGAPPAGPETSEGDPH